MAEMNNDWLNAAQQAAINRARITAKSFCVPFKRQSYQYKAYEKKYLRPCSKLAANKS